MMPPYKLQILLFFVSWVASENLGHVHIINWLIYLFALHFVWTWCSSFYSVSALDEEGRNDTAHALRSVNTKLTYHLSACFYLAAEDAKVCTSNLKFSLFAPPGICWLLLFCVNIQNCLRFQSLRNFLCSVLLCMPKLNIWFSSSIKSLNSSRLAPLSWIGSKSRGSQGCYLGHSHVLYLQYPSNKQPNKCCCILKIYISLHVSFENMKKW